MAAFNPDQPHVFLDDLMRAALGAANPLEVVPPSFAGGTFGDVLKRSGVTGCSA